MLVNRLAVGDTNGNNVSFEDKDSPLGDMPKKDGSVYVQESVVFKPRAGDPSAWDPKDIFTGESQATAGELAYSQDKDAFYHYNGSIWQSQSGSGAGNIIQFACSWRYDYLEGSVGNGEAANWGCQPQTCPNGWVQVGSVWSEPLSVVCPGNVYCIWGDTGDAYKYHPVSAGRSVRACLMQ